MTCSRVAKLLSLRQSETDKSSQVGISTVFQDLGPTAVGSPSTLELLVEQPAAVEAVLVR